MKRSAFIKEHQDEWRTIGHQYRFVRELLHFSQNSLAKCIGLSPSVIFAFEEGQPIQRHRFVEGAYRAALTSIFYSYNLWNYEKLIRHSFPIFILTDLVANLLHHKNVSLKTLSELVNLFGFKIKFKDEYWTNILDERGYLLFSVHCEEVI